MNRCGFCNKEYDEKYNYCPYCGEPRLAMEDDKKENAEETAYKALLILPVIGFVGGMVASMIVGWIIHFIRCIFYIFKGYTIPQLPRFSTPLEVFVICGVIVAVIMFVLSVYAVNKREKNIREGILPRKREPSRKEIIREQFRNDSTSICPECGSHNISLGRKGYDWSKAAWYSFFGIKEGVFWAGKDERRVTAYCNNCHHKWLTDREWIK